MDEQPLTEQAPPHCSFCDKDASKAIGLVSNGNGMTICDECVLACCDTLAGSLQVPQSALLSVLQYRQAVARSQARAAEAAAEFTKVEAEHPELVFPNGAVPPADSGVSLVKE